MSNKAEKARRKRILHSIREDQRRQVRQSVPVEVPVLRALFAYVDLRLEDTECDHTLRHTREFIRNHGLPEDALISWLEDNGGYCDCEAVVNAEQIVEEAVPGYKGLAADPSSAE